MHPVIKCKIIEIDLFNMQLLARNMPELMIKQYSNYVAFHDYSGLGGQAAKVQSIFIVLFPLKDCFFESQNV